MFSDGANIEIAEEVCDFSALSRRFANNFDYKTSGRREQRL